ncbi:MAG: 50S ribosomal protein L3 [Armatimonadetes bacterium]|nr:50S ribosomal protein L3 [Armatimonadota bacterium]
MPTGLLGRKVGMTRIFDEAGNAVPVTVVQAGPCVVVQRKTADKDGYDAVQMGFEEQKRSRVNEPMMGHFASRNIEPQKTLREFRLMGDEDPQPGDVVTVEMFEEGQVVDVSGTTKGRGFAGGMKRHGFKGGPASHGSKVHRTPQSAGATDAQRVFKGKRSPGHMGSVKRTVRGLQVVKVDAERNLLLIKGAVPGPNGGLLTIRPRV